jgi:transposase-like protein
VFLWSTEFKAGLIYGSFSPGQQRVSKKTRKFGISSSSSKWQFVDDDDAAAAARRIPKL